LTYILFSAEGTTLFENHEERQALSPPPSPLKLSRFMADADLSTRPALREKYKIEPFKPIIL